MSKFFKALEQAERDNAQQESPAPPQATAEAVAEAAADTVSERSPVISRWPEPEKEQPPVFTPPAPRAVSQAIDPPRPVVDAPGPVFEPPRPSVDARRPVFEAPRPVVQKPRIATALLDEHLVSLQAPSTAAAEQYRVLRHLVETLRKR